MQGFPPPPGQQVTLENWRQAPFNRWSFHHVRNLLPTAAVRRGTEAWRLPRRPLQVETLLVEDARGVTKTLGALLDETFTDAFIVLHRGAIVAERYLNGMQPEDPHIVMSVTKSVTGTLAGVLVEEGRLEPDAPVARYLPEVAGSAYAQATVRNLLDMTVGIDWGEDYYAAGGTMIRYREVSGWKPRSAESDPRETLREFLVSLPAKGAHGRRFHYVSPNSDLLGWVLERAGGLPWSELLGRRIWAPMGACHDAYVTVDSMGAQRAAGGLCVTLGDLARFGQMMLDRGFANGRQVLPPAWVDDCRRGGDPQAWADGDMATFFPGGRYRNQWYQVGNERGAFCALGLHGQYLYVDPAASAVIARFSSHPEPTNEPMERNLMAAFDRLARSL
jgi:CubicO group peptidase (beta-lactamase class C family)